MAIGPHQEQTQALPLGRQFKGRQEGTVHQATAWTDQIDLKDNPVRDAAEIDVHVSMRWRK